MGIDYKAAIYVGLPRDELMKQAADSEKIGDLIEQEELEVCPPYYDGSGSSAAIVGFEYMSSGRYSAKELVWSLERFVELLKKFHDLTGVTGKVWLSPYGY